MKEHLHSDLNCSRGKTRSVKSKAFAIPKTKPRKKLKLFYIIYFINYIYKNHLSLDFSSSTYR